MLTPVGLFLNFIGSIVLLGSDIKLIKRLLKKIDPAHRVYKKGLDRVIKKSTNKQKVEQRKAHPYDGPIHLNHWSWVLMSWFLNRHAEQNVSRNSEIDIRGGWFKVDGEELIFSEERTIQLDNKAQLTARQTMTLTAIHGLLYEARMKRIYIYGVSLLALGFLLQLISSLNVNSWIQNAINLLG